MDKIFGLSMDTIMIALVILLALCLLVVAWIAWRQSVVFKMGMRNIPRRKTQTALILIGLMLATVISTAALGMGDTIDESLTAATFDVLGEVDELVVYSPEADANVGNALGTKMPAAALQTVEQALANNQDVDGIMPALLEFVPAISERTKLSTPNVFLVGIDPSRVADFGGLLAPNGDEIDLSTLAADQIVISESTVDELDAKVGDTITIYYGGQPIPAKVAAVAVNGPLSGVLEPNHNPGMVVPLDRLQEGTNQVDRLSFIAISNTGGVRDGVDRTDAVEKALEPALAGQSLGIDTIKQTSIENSELASSGLTGLFLVLGLFSISVGILLIILIFSMLAAERRPEMGMARAIGQQRRQLIQQFIAEGSGYALLSGMVGAAAGVAVTFALGAIFSGVVDEFFTVSPTVTPRSAIVGYCLGVVITFFAIVISSWRASRINVVAAIRDLPDVAEYRRRPRTIVFAGLLLLIGALLAFTGQTGSVGRAFFFYFGMSLMPFGIALLARYFGAPSRAVFTIVGIYILVLWFLPASIANRLFGELGGDFEMFFLSGIFMVAGATMLIVQNLDLLLGGVSRIGGVFQSKLPAVRTAIAYPGAVKGRTGMTIAMFSLIVFSLVCFATISENFANLFLSDDADAGWDVQVEVASANQLPNKDLVAALNGAGVDTADITAVGWSDNAAPAAAIRQANATDEEYQSILWSGMNDALIQESDLSFQARAEGYGDDAAIVNALLTEPNVAVVDSSVLEGQGGGFGAPDGFSLTGVGADDKVFAPVEIDLLNPQTQQPVRAKIIGIIESDLSSLFGLFTNRTLSDQLYPQPVATTYRVRLDDADDSKERAKAFERALITSGGQASSYKEIQEEGQAQFRGFLTLIQGFMGLGLVVGIAAVGVIAFRAVVERRQQIGVLRAIGYQRSMVSLSFLIETIFVVGLGVISGTILAVALAWQLFSDDEFSGGGQTVNFVVPWTLLVAIVVIAFAMALLMTWVPSRQAASVSPAEALRYE